jgi:sortase A
MGWKAAPTVTRILRSLERVFLVIGVALLGAYLGVRLYGVVASQAVVAAYEQGPSPGFVSSSTNSSSSSAYADADANWGVDTSLWSEKRIRAYQASLNRMFGMPEALLEIPKIHLEVPVFEGTDDVTLDRGTGRIEGTARPGETGNVGIAGHRDGFFRGLKDVNVGDEIKLIVGNVASTYVIDQIKIVTPQDVSVLAPRPVSSITLVTCYPFYFIGPAPERYIVSASLRADAQPAVSGNVRPNH